METSNPTITCNAIVCDGQFKWSDQSTFAWDPFYAPPAANNDQYACFAMSSTIFETRDCTLIKDFLCEYDCDNLQGKIFLFGLYDK